MISLVCRRDTLADMRCRCGAGRPDTRPPQCSNTAPDTTCTDQGTDKILRPHAHSTTPQPHIPTVQYQNRILCACHINIITHASRQSANTVQCMGQCAQRKRYKHLPQGWKVCVTPISHFPFTDWRWSGQRRQRELPAPCVARLRHGQEGWGRCRRRWRLLARVIEAQ